MSLPTWQWEKQDIDEAAVEAAVKSAEDALHGLKHDHNAEEIAHLQGMIAQSMAKLKLKRKRRNI